TRYTLAQREAEWEAYVMAHEPHDPDFLSEGADDAHSAGGGARASDRAMAVSAGGGQVMVEDVDLGHVSDVLAALGADGSPQLEALPASAAIDLLQGMEKIVGAIAAVQARTLVHLESAIEADCREDGETGRDAARIARTEAAHVMKKSRSSAGQSMH